MIIRRGIGQQVFSKNKMLFYSGYSPNGKLRPSFHGACYQSWARFTGIHLKPGETKEITIIETILMPGIKKGGPPCSKP